MVHSNAINEYKQQEKALKVIIRMIKYRITMVSHSLFLCLCWTVGHNLMSCETKAVSMDTQNTQDSFPGGVGKPWWMVYSNNPKNLKNH